MAGTFETFGRYLDRCESPLERRFLRALLFSEAFGFRPIAGRARSEIAEDDEGVILGQQVRVCAYRVDFAMKRMGSRGRIAIELDGRTFHSSAEQIERDKVRDRVLLACGWTTLRFSSREIMQDAVTCAKQAYEIVLRFDGPKVVIPPLAKAIAADGQRLLVANGLSFSDRR
jgi:very-short-patch-repair endonuclease